MPSFPNLVAVIALIKFCCQMHLIHVLYDLLSRNCHRWRVQYRIASDTGVCKRFVWSGTLFMNVVSRFEGQISSCECGLVMCLHVSVLFML